MNSGRRIGLMGGTFDPPHVAHVVSVEIAAAEFSLDWVWFVPAFLPPHKLDQPRTNPFHRMAMLALALKRFPAFKISPLELLRADISFTIDTIRGLQSELDADDRLFFMMGSDSFLEVHTWYEPAELLASCEWIILDRGSGRDELRKNLKQLEANFKLNLENSVHFASSPHLPFSSTNIRQLIDKGESPSRMLFPEVESYIHKHCLYRR